MNNFPALHKAAELAGREAALAAAPQMIKVKDGSGKVFGPFPICGFAWVVVKPNRGKFAEYLKEFGGFKKHYGGGISYWIHDYDQSFDMKRAHATAYAKALKDAGYDAYADSRLD